MPLGKNADAGDYVKDFQKSKAPQFKGKSKEKRRKMAIAAYLDAKDKKESKMKSFDDLRNEAANPAQQAAIAIAMKKAGKKPKNEGAMKRMATGGGMKTFKPKPPAKSEEKKGKKDMIDVKPSMEASELPKK